jgi:hypothetical protein
MNINVCLILALLAHAAERYVRTTHAGRIGLQQGRI